jgi:curved DNA-binding protein CbpA
MPHLRTSKRHTTRKLARPIQTKNPDDPEAPKKFQRLGHAYQILLNEQYQAKYDKQGKPESSAAEMNEIDPYVFFAVMFGSELVEPYIGELWIANTADYLMKDAADQQFGAEEERTLPTCQGHVGRAKV